MTVLNLGASDPRVSAAGDSTPTPAHSRRDFLGRTLRGTVAGFVLTTPPLDRVAAASGVAKTPRAPRGIAPSDLSFLADLARATLDSARVPPGERRGGLGPNTTGIPLITPGGNYPALWVRDFALSLDCGLVGTDELQAHLELIARTQNGEQERRLKSGAIIPPFAIPDHVNLDGSAVFYPGTFSSGEDQGAAPWGPLPPADDHFYFVHIASQLRRRLPTAEFLSRRLAGARLLERLKRAFAAVETDARTGAVVATKARRAVGFGFQDSVRLLGSMGFATLLRHQAAKELAELCRMAGEPRDARRYEELARQIRAHLVPVFSDPSRKHGWLLAATEVGRQPDAWATLFALHSGLLPEEAAERARSAVARSVRAAGHDLEYQGAVRHVPKSGYFTPDQCWESSVGATDTYQSGAFWHTPTGWLIEALESIDPDMARAVSERFLRHLREDDFRRGAGRKAPWECFGLEFAGAQNPVYLTSVTVPLAVLREV